MGAKRLGFSLIEVMMLVALLGLATAVVVPRFLSLTREARLSMLEGLQQNIKTSVALAQLKYKAAGGVGSSIVIDDRLVQVVPGTGVPVVSAGGIDVAISFKVKHGLGISTSLGDARKDEALFFYSGTVMKPDCAVIYSQLTGSVQLLADGC